MVQYKYESRFCHLNRKNIRKIKKINQTMMTTRATTKFSVIMINYYPTLVTWVPGNWRLWRFCGLHQWRLELSCYCQASPLLSQTHFDVLCKWHTVTHCKSILTYTILLFPGQKWFRLDQDRLCGWNYRVIVKLHRSWAKRISMCSVSDTLWHIVKVYWHTQSYFFLDKNGLG